ncbi:hypothetical protein [Kytococcus sedentarius]|uniref:hypothetical protein n=1 Tax=Kytococcus sedentarius TaxID=1276 RepID=UPI0035BBA977
MTPARGDAPAEPDPDPAAASESVRTAMAERQNALAALTRAESGLADAVQRARRAGLSWQQLADLLGVTRQGAAQRFGGETATPGPVPAGSALARHGGGDDAPLTEQVGRLGVHLVQQLLAGELSAVRELLSSTARRQLTREVLGSLAQEVPDLMGTVQRVELDAVLTPEGAAPRTEALPLVARLELVAEHGRPVAHVLVGRAGSVGGLSIRPSEAHETWPL